MHHKYISRENMSTVTVDKSVDKIPFSTNYPAILGKVANWLKNRQFAKPL